MVRGVGIDSASIEVTRWACEALGEDYLSHVFSPAEIAQARRRTDGVAYLTARFAVKEAAFKALAHLTAARTFDLRIVETIDGEDGCPAITCSDVLRAVMGEAGVSELFVSITTEGDLATAVVVAE